MAAIFLLSLLVGLLAGVLAGLFGIGGGLVIVPILVMIFSAHGFAAEQVMIMAVATSLATIVFTALSSAFAHHRLGAVWWPRVIRLAPGIMLGSGLGALVADHIDANLLRAVFIVFLLYVGVQMALQLQPKPGAVKESKILDMLVSVLIGLLSALVGIGGGTLTVPYLVSCRAPMKNAVAISSACGVPIAIAGTISYALLGWHAALPEWSLGYVYLPSFLGIGLSSVFTAPIGAKLAHKLPAQQLKRYFSVLIFVMAAKLIWY
ncbi:MAG: sulfite exporter TauE/SafE family protein [Methylococcales bacterium]